MPLNLIDEMYEWLTSLTWGDMRKTDFDQLELEELVDGIETHYTGGVQQFIADST